MMALAAIMLIWGAGWTINLMLARRGGNGVGWMAPLVFGLTILLIWEVYVRLAGVSPIILPPPSAIAVTFSDSLPLLWADFAQTILKGAMTGYVLGAIAAFAIAVLADRSDFLMRGILPVGGFMAALPIVGTAPIFVKWLGSDWPSKAAVVGVMVFFPILVNTVAGLRDTTTMQRDLMRTYGAGYWPTLLKLRLPAALPFIFNGLKIATTLALIGAIVAEFFGSPTVGMGFRISTSVGQLALDLVWAEIVVAALAGSAFYGVMAWIEGRLTFWHPSQRT
ncbi:ABC transporter permease [Loktanella sp. SALINAS62]|uniref:ABC transporter permease n=1 Tax=Loktanella sp. SALINAS62 TaxID=2706124 RepID=UPI001B8C89DE|nr:ABC transporter permease [Loktanella sp. SALINAS62]MBS1301854.1 ABC transporter permease [Loktanella sp. SALINAS62]